MENTNKKDKVFAGLLAILFGIWGAHKFYHGHIILGIFYALITFGSWSAIINHSSMQTDEYNYWASIFWLSLLWGSSLIEGIVYLKMKKSTYDKRYNEKTARERLNSDFAVIDHINSIILFVPFCIALCVVPSCSLGYEIGSNLGYIYYGIDYGAIGGAVVGGIVAFSILVGATFAFLYDRYFNSSNNTNISSDRE